jgi:hypothetical protein
MPPTRRPNLWRAAQLDLLAIEAEIDRVRSLGLDTLAQAVLRNLSRSRLTTRG